MDLTNEEEKLIKIFRSLPDKEKYALLRTAEILKNIKSEYGKILEFPKKTDK